MSRIVALLHRDQRPAERAALQSLIAPLKHIAVDGPRFWVCGQAGLAYQCLQTTSSPDDLQPVHDAGQTALVFDGRLDNRHELIEVLAGDLRADAPDVSDAALILACYRRYGQTFAKHLNGDYALIVWDEPQRRLLLSRDVIGTRPLYYWASGDTAIAASEIKAILQHPKVQIHPDDNALADVLAGGNPNERRLTCFRDVFRVLPGHTVIVTPERIQELIHWDFDPTRQIRLGSVGEYAEALRELFQRAVLQRLRNRGPAAVMVSGGLDSSAILCQAEKLRQAGTPLALTVGISHTFPDHTAADEKRFLLDIEHMYQTRIRRLPFERFRYVDDPRWVWICESPRLPWDSELETLKTARDLGCSTIIDGEYGDIAVASFANLWDSARKFQYLKLAKEFRALSKSMTDLPPKILAQDLLRPFLRDLVPDGIMRLVRSLRWLRNRNRSLQWYTARFRELAYHRSQQQRRDAIPFSTKHAQFLYRYFHSFHVVNGFEERDKLAAEFGLGHAHPFVDRDLIAFMMSIPAEIVHCGGAYKSLFREAMRGVLPESIRSRYWKADFGLVDNDAAAAGIPRFLKLFQADCLSVRLAYVNAATVKDAISRHEAALTGERLAPSVQMTTLAALELWLETFFDAQQKSRELSRVGSPVYQYGSNVPK